MWYKYKQHRCFIKIGSICVNILYISCAREHYILYIPFVLLKNYCIFAKETIVYEKAER